MGTNLCKALPAFHAYTGSDFTSAFVRIGKIRPLSLLENSPTFQNTFIKMASSSELEADTFRSLCQYMAAMHGRPNTSHNQARLEIFERAYKPSKRGHRLSKLKGIDGSNLPPCEAELFQHAKRASFVSKMWATAVSSEIKQLPNDGEGWELHNGEYRIIWFEGRQLPESLKPDNIPLHYTPFTIYIHLTTRTTNTSFSHHAFFSYFGMMSERL